MDNKMNYTYDAKFEGNILVVGRNSCGKTTFVQNVGKNKMFADIKEVMWISKYHFPLTEKIILETVLLIK